VARNPSPVVHLSAAEKLELTPYHRLVLGEEGLPAAVSQFPQAGGGVHDVREENGRQDGFGQRFGTVTNRQQQARLVHSRQSPAVGVGHGARGQHQVVLAFRDLTVDVDGPAVGRCRPQKAEAHVEHTEPVSGGGEGMSRRGCGDVRDRGEDSRRDVGAVVAEPAAGRHGRPVPLAFVDLSPRESEERQQRRGT
jgi:hypothetical protein